MSGNLWMFSDMLDDEDIEMLRRDFISYYQGADYYGLGLKMFTRIAWEAGAVYKIGNRLVRVRRDIVDEYLRMLHSKQNGGLADDDSDQFTENKLEQKEDARMKQGVLVEDSKTGRIDIRFGLDDYFGGLHCGTCLDVLVNDEWVPTRIEMGTGWYLVGVKTDRLPGLTVRIG